MKKIKEWMGKNPLWRLLAATLFLSLGVYLSFPEKGFLATLPLNFLCYFVSSLLFCDWRIVVLFPTAIAFLFGKASLLPDPFSYALFAFLTALPAHLSAKSFLGMKKKVFFAIPATLLLVLGVIVPMWYSGTPTAWLSAYDRALSYLSEHYPDQEFCEVKMHYDLQSSSYRTLVLYEYETGTLTSNLTFGEDEVEDGFFDDFTLWMTEKRKTEVISSFRRISASVFTDSSKVVMESDVPLKGSYGNIDESVIPYMQYSVTLREEKPERKEFAEECSRLLKALQEDGVKFGKITFYGLDAGNTVHRLEVSFDSPSDPDSLLSDVVNA